MSDTFDRALLLYEQSRYDLAEQELRRGLSQDPDDAVSHALLSLCQCNLKKYPEATHEAEEALRLAPHLPFVHYALANVLYQRDHLKEAEAAIAQAIELDPTDAGYLSLLAAIHFDQKRWQDALTAAERGLVFDAEHDGCTNIRAMALVKLGRKQEAGLTIDTALQRDPDNALSHANRGWTLL